MPPKIQEHEMVGKTFGRLTVIKRNSCGKDYWICYCACGSETTQKKSGQLLRSGQVKSCGCLQRENALKQAENNVGSNGTHYMTRSKEYRAWVNMKARCDDKNHKAYERYGGRGITYDISWSSFVNFYNDMGDCPPKLTLDRTDTNGNYCKDNCQWVSRVIQRAHTRKPISGRTSKFKGVSFNTNMGKFKGCLKYNGELYHLGYHECDQVLALRYDDLLFELSGDIEGTNKALGLFTELK